MLNFSPEKILFLLVVALVVLGPQRLPGAARSMGKLLANLRQLTGNLQNEMNTALAEPREVLRGTVEEMGLDDIRQTVQSLRPRNALNPLVGLNPLAAPATPAAPSATTPAPADTPGQRPATGTGPALAGPVGAAPGSDLPPPPDDPALN